MGVGALLMAVVLCTIGLVAELGEIREEVPERSRGDGAVGTDSEAPTDGEAGEPAMPAESDEIPPPADEFVDLDHRWQIIRTVDRNGTVRRPPKLAPMICEFDSSREIVRIMERAWVRFTRHENGDLTYWLPGAPESMTVRPRRSGDILTLWILEGPEDADDTTSRMVFRLLPDAVGGRWSDAGVLLRILTYYEGRMRSGGMNLPRRRRMSDVLRADLPEDLRDPARLLESHLAFLDREKDGGLRDLARLALVFAEDAVDLLLERRAWRDLTLQGKREVASLLGYPETTTVAKLAPLLGEPADPVILMALMLQTRHTFGSPPRFLLPDAPAPDRGIGTHWRSWLKETWTEPPPKPEARLAEDVRAILVLFDSRNRESRTRGSDGSRP